MALTAQHQAESDLQLVAEEERFILSQMAGVDGGLLSNENFLHNPDVLRQLNQLASSSLPISSTQLGPAVTRDEFLLELEQHRHLAQNGTVDPLNSDYGRTRYAGVVPLPSRRLRILDVIRTAQMEGRTISYTAESALPSGGPDTTAAETPEGELKPEATIAVEDREAVAVTVAHWIKARRQVLADTLGLEALIRARLTQGVQQHIEDQIISGDGEGEHLRGILRTTGVAYVEYSAEALAADQALAGIVNVLLGNANPNAVICHPVDWAALKSAKPESGDGHYFSGGPFVSTNQSLWDVPVIPSPAMPVGELLVGDFTGATLFIREGVNVTLGQEQDDMTRNRVTLLGEARVALAVFQPANFAVVHLTDSD